jgi:hypothetical protein
VPANELSPIVFRHELSSKQISFKASKSMKQEGGISEMVFGRKIERLR